ncbi:hypothetical protein GGS21DRAFT_489575 [Xylaria nigripes]|nr:hypothetical protein GGS21DRAFT_489575 [Xylaria nigripes]
MDSQQDIDQAAIAHVKRIIWAQLDGSSDIVRLPMECYDCLDSNAKTEIIQQISAKVSHDVEFFFDNRDENRVIIGNVAVINKAWSCEARAVAGQAIKTLFEVPLQDLHAFNFRAPPRELPDFEEFLRQRPPPKKRRGVAANADDEENVRPRLNAFILYRCYWSKQLGRARPDFTNGRISNAIGGWWKSLSRNEQDPWYVESRREVDGDAPNNGRRVPKRARNQLNDNEDGESQAGDGNQVNGASNTVEALPSQNNGNQDDVNNQPAQGVEVDVLNRRQRGHHAKRTRRNNGNGVQEPQNGGTGQVIDLSNLTGFPPIQEAGSSQQPGLVAQNPVFGSIGSFVQSRYQQSEMAQNPAGPMALAQPGNQQTTVQIEQPLAQQQLNGFQTAPVQMEAQQVHLTTNAHQSSSDSQGEQGGLTPPNTTQSPSLKDKEVMVVPVQTQGSQLDNQNDFDIDAWLGNVLNGDQGIADPLQFGEGNPALANPALVDPALANPAFANPIEPAQVNHEAGISSLNNFGNSAFTNYGQGNSANVSFGEANSGFVNNGEGNPALNNFADNNMAFNFEGNNMPLLDFEDNNMPLLNFEENNMGLLDFGDFDIDFSLPSGAVGE